MNISSRQQRIVIIGNGMVGHHFVEQLINSEHNCHITVLSGESRLAYDRVYLSSYFSGKTAADLALTDEQTYQDWGVNAVTNAWVTDIDREKHRLPFRQDHIACVNDTQGPILQAQSHRTIGLEPVEQAVDAPAIGFMHAHLRTARGACCDPAA